MAHMIAKEEVLKIARISNLSVHEEQIQKVTRQLDAVLLYAARVKEVFGKVDDVVQTDMKHNKTRLDIVDQVSSDVLLAQVPIKEGNLIIVPKILETT